MSISPEGRAARARLAALKRHRGDAADVADETALLERERLDQRIDELVAAAPRMTPEQAARLRRLLNPPAAVR
jgi:hypothetical protein